MNNVMDTLAKVARGALLARYEGNANKRARVEENRSGGLSSLFSNWFSDKPQFRNSLEHFGEKYRKWQHLRQGELGVLLDDLGEKDPPEESGSLGNLFNAAVRGKNTQTHLTPKQEKQAEVLLKAMICATKCNGELDDQEQENILNHVGNMSETEVQFLKSEMATPTNIHQFINEIPFGMEKQVYLMSLMVIDWDVESEVQYIDLLRRRLHISEADCNDIHQRLGTPFLYH